MKLLLLIALVAGVAFSESANMCEVGTQTHRGLIYYECKPTLFGNLYEDIGCAANFDGDRLVRYEETIDKYTDNVFGFRYMCKKENQYTQFEIVACLVGVDRLVVPVGETGERGGYSYSCTKQRNGNVKINAETVRGH